MRAAGYVVGQDLRGVTRRGALLAVALVVALMAVSVGGGISHALSPDERLKDAGLETRARELSAELRCLVCQNQSIDDSDAPLAKDLRRLVRERLTAGDSNAEVKSFLVERYGDFVLLKPPLGWHTLILWFAPLLVLLATLAFVGRAMIARRAATEDAPARVGLSAEEEARLARLMGKGPEDRG